MIVESCEGLGDPSPTPHRPRLPVALSTSLAVQREGALPTHGPQPPPGQSLNANILYDILSIPYTNSAKPDPFQHPLHPYHREPYLKQTLPLHPFHPYQTCSLGFARTAISLPDPLYPFPPLPLARRIVLDPVRLCLIFARLCQQVFAP